MEDLSVVLKLDIPGQQVSYGKYEYKERTTKGSVLPEDQRLFTIKKVENSDCYRKVILSNSFCRYAISDEARPTRNDNYKAYVFWRKMSTRERLLFHIAKYVSDCNASTYKFEIS